MSDQPKDPRTVKVRAAKVKVRAATLLLVVTGGIALLALVVHTPFVRARVLRYALAEVQVRYAVRLEASRLDYNLPALRIGLAGLRVSVLAETSEPFFEADYLAVTLPREALFGAVAFDDITVTNGLVRVVRRRDGTSNLPETSATTDDEPPPLNIARLDIPRLAIDVRDEQADVSLRMPAVALQVTPDDGRVALGAPAELRAGTRMSRILQLDGQVAFDGRALRLKGTQVRADEAAINVDGSIVLIARDPSIDLRIQGSADAARLARWGIPDGEVPQGTLALDGQLTGPMSDPQTDLRVSTDRLTWQGVAVTAVSARARVSTAAADVQQLEFGFQDGRVTASANVPFDATAAGTLTASWTDIDAASTVLALAPASELVPAGVVSGRLDAEGPPSDLNRLSVDARVRIDPRPNARGRIALGGEARLRLSEGSWRLDGRQVIGGVAPVALALRGRLSGGPDRPSRSALPRSAGAVREGGPPSQRRLVGSRSDPTVAEAEGPRLRASTITGTIRLDRTNVAGVLDVLRTTSLSTASPDVIRGGAFDADIQLAGRITDPDMQATVRVRDLVGAQIDAREIDVMLSGRPLEPQLAFTLGSPRALIAGEAVSDVRSTGRVVGSALVVDELIARQPSTSGLLAGFGRYDLGRTQYTASLAANQWRLTPTLERPLGGLVNLRFGGEGTTAEPRGAADMSLRGAVWQDIALGSLDAAVRLDGQSATIRARAPDFRTDANARVQIDAPYAATIDVRADQVDLARVLRGAGETDGSPLPIEGTAVLRAHAEGPLASWRDGSATIEVPSLDAVAGDLPIRLIEPARLRYGSQRVYIDKLEATAGDTHISASGELPASDPAPDAPALLLAVTGDIDEVARAVAATGVTQVPIAGGDGPVALLARVTGTLQTPVIAADLEVGPGSLTLEDLPPVSELRVRAHAEEGWIELREATASYQGANLSATGKAPLSLLMDVRRPSPAPFDRLRASRARQGTERTRLEEIVLQARATNVTPAVIAPFVDAATLEQLDGSVDATLDARSQTLDLADLAGELRLDRLDLRIADLPVTQRTPTRIVARNGFARIEAWDWMGQGATLGVRGQVRLSDRQAAILANGELDLRMLTPFVRDAGMTPAGRLEPRLSITGTLDSPRIDGDLLITGGELRLVDPRILVSDIAARAVLTRTSARLASLTGLVNGGPLTGSGTIELGEEGRLDVAFSTDIRGMALEFPQGLRSEIDAALQLNMARVGENPSGQLSGTVTVVRGAYREPLAVVTGLLTTLRTRRLATSADASPLLASLALDVRLLTDEDISVDNNYGRFQLGGDLRVIGTAAVPALSGRAELREGGQLFVGRNVYTINSGTIDFANPVTIEPDLNVEATTRAGGEDIEVTITGTPDTISVDLRSPSNPDLGQAELTSLLLTGRRFEDLAPGDAAFVGTQVLGNFSAEVLGFASQAVGLDSLRLGGVENAALRRDPTAVATELDPTTRLTFGKSLGADVDVTFSQSLRDGDAQTWIVDYLPARRLELRLVSDDDDLRSYGFRHDVAFRGAAARPAASAGQSERRPAERVAAVSVTGDLIFAEAHVRKQLRLDAGDRFDFGAWQEDRDRLEQFYHRQGYLTARVAATRSESREGVALVYQVTAGPQTKIAVMGLELDSPLRSRLEEAWSQSVFDDFLVEEATAIVKEALASRGYLQPVVEARVVTDADARILTVRVDAGSQSSRTTLRIEGTDEALTRRIEAWLESSGLVSRATTDPGRLERELTAYLRSNGYLQARVTAGTPLFQGGSAVVPVNVTSGPIFTIASISFEGADGLPVDTLRDTVALVEGMPYDPAASDAARDRLVALYRREGYPSPAVMIRQDVRTDPPAVDLSYAIDTGVRQVLGEIIVSGNRAIDADVIVGALGLPLNAPLTAEASLQARRRVFDTGLFRRVDLSSEPLEPSTRGGRELLTRRSPAEAVPMRVRVTVEEWPALRLRYGFQVVEERPEGEVEGRDLVPGLSADLTRRTLFGRAIGVGGALELQRRERLARGFVNAPTLRGWPIESSLSLNRTWRTVGSTNRSDDRTGLSWEQRLRLLSDLQLSYGYRFERSRTDVPSDPIIGPLPPIVLNIARLSAAASWDTRDDPSDTTRGSLLSSSLEFAPEAAGSDIRFIRYVAQAYYFRPWRRLVLASAGRVGLVSPLGGQDLILSERFFTGGAGTVRGVAEDSLGERDFFGDPVGGQALLVLNQEVRLPIYRWLRGVGFVDAGNVFARPGDIGLRRLVGSIGFGLRLATPFALLRADYAKPVWAGSLERSGRWNFGIGHAF